MTCWSRLSLVRAIAIVVSIATAHEVVSALIVRPEAVRPQACAPPLIFSMPSRVSAGDQYYGRLIPQLSVIAIVGNGDAAVVQAAMEFYRARRPTPVVGFLERARAYADLAVTGSRSYRSLQQLGMTRAGLRQAVRDRVERGLLASGARPIDRPLLDDSIVQAVDRAYNVAWALRGPASFRVQARPGLGWIAVSGESDRPDRPVNAASAPYPQRTIELTVGPHRVQTRIVFIDPWLVEPTVADRERLPGQGNFPVVVGDIYLFLHGHGSTAEEALGVAESLIDRAARAGRRLTVVSLDLPGYAYSSPISTNALPPLPLDTRNPRVFGGLDVLEGSIVNLVDRLEAQQPGISRQILGVMGGSLGGNLSLRLARRSGTPYPWLGHNVAWSPASVWPSFADNCEGQDGYGGCDLDLTDHAETAVWGSHKNATESGDGETRAYFFSEERTRVPANYTYAERWFSASWPCKRQTIEASKWSTGEYFNEAYRKWHWRIAHEQLIYTHTAYRASDPSRFGVRSRLLLAAGAEDNHNPEFLFQNAAAMASAMSRVEGTGLLLSGVGHSIHTELPDYWGARITDFIATVPSAPMPAFLIDAAVF